MTVAVTVGMPVSLAMVGPAPRAMSAPEVVPVAASVTVSLGGAVLLTVAGLVSTVSAGVTFTNGSGAMPVSEPRSVTAGTHPVAALRAGPGDGTRIRAGAGYGAGAIAVPVFPFVEASAPVEAVAAPIAAIPVLVAAPGDLPRAGARGGGGAGSLTARRPIARQATQPSRVPRLRSGARPLGVVGMVRTLRSVTTAAEIPRITLAASGGAAGAVGRAVSGAWPTGRLGRERGMGCRGHRPIIARTTGALCSPRPS